VLLVLHSGAGDVDVELPAWLGDTSFVPELTSGTPDGVPTSVEPVPAGSSVTVPPHSFLVFRSV
jgi:isoamylase